MVTSSRYLSNVDAAKKCIKNETRLECKLLNRKTDHSIHILEKKIFSTDIAMTSNCSDKQTAFLLKLNSVLPFNHLKHITYSVSPNSLVVSKTSGLFFYSLLNKTILSGSPFFQCLPHSAFLLPPLPIHGQFSPRFLFFELVPPLVTSCGKLKALYLFRNLPT